MLGHSRLQGTFWSWHRQEWNISSFEAGTGKNKTSLLFGSSGIVRGRRHAGSRARRAAGRQDSRTWEAGLARRGGRQLAACSGEAGSSRLCSAGTQGGTLRQTARGVAVRRAALTHLVKYDLINCERAWLTATAAADGCSFRNVEHSHSETY